MRIPAAWDHFLQRLARAKNQALGEYNLLEEMSP